jgi:hypothetical protein
MNFLKGYKTYIVAAGAIITALGAYLSESISLTELVMSIFSASGLAALRAGVKTDVSKLGLFALCASLFAFTSCAWLETQPASTQAAIDNMKAAVAQQAKQIADTTLDAVATGKSSQEIKNALIQSSGDAVRSLEGTAVTQVTSAAVQDQLHQWVPASSPWWKYSSAIGGLVQTYVNTHPGNPQWANAVLEAVAGALNTHTP